MSSKRAKVCLTHYPSRSREDGQYRADVVDASVFDLEHWMYSKVLFETGHGSEFEVANEARRWMAENGVTEATP